MHHEPFLIVFWDLMFLRFEIKLVCQTLRSDLHSCLMAADATWDPYLDEDLEDSATEPDDLEQPAHPRPNKGGSAKARRLRKRASILRSIYDEEGQAKAKAKSNSKVSQLTECQARNRRKKNAKIRERCAREGKPVPAFAQLLPSLPDHLQPIDDEPVSPVVGRSANSSSSALPSAGSVGASASSSSSTAITQYTSSVGASASSSSSTVPIHLPVASSVGAEASWFLVRLQRQ